MKLDVITVTAFAVAGLAVFTVARKWRQANPQHDPTISDADARAAYGMARDQRQASGAAIPQNLAYLEFWDSPMANTLYGTGSLGD